MSKIIFNKKDIAEAKNGVSKEIRKYGDELKRNIENGKANLALGNLIDSLMVNNDFREEFTYHLNNRLGLPRNKGLIFNDITTTTVDSEIGTEVMPTMERLIRDTGLLGRMNIREIQPNKYHPINDYGAEQDAENLAEQDEGNEVDEIFRDGDLLIAKTKVQASTTITELALTTFESIDLATLLARQFRRVEVKLIDNALNAGAGVANGTVRTPGKIRGINNNYGVNGTGDATNYIGAITYATKADADAALGGATADSYDLAVQVKRKLLPNDLQVEENQYIYIMNRATWGDISTQLDANGRYKSDTAINPTTGQAMKMIDGSEVVISSQVADNFVFLVPLSFYTMVIDGGIRQLTDNGLVELKQGNILYVTRAFVDGSMEYGHKYLPTTAATIGTTPVDNQNQNAFRYFRIT